MTKQEIILDLIEDASSLIDITDGISEEQVKKIVKRLIKDLEELD